MAYTAFAGTDVYYVSISQGDDSNSGKTENQSWKSLPYAISYLLSLPDETRGSVEIRIDNGDYFLNNPIEIVGKHFNGIFKIRAINSGRVTLRGDCPIKITSSDGLLRKADLRGVDLGVAVGEKNRLDLFCNDRKQKLSSWPNEGYLRINHPLGKTVIKDGIRKEPIFGYTDKHISEFAKQKDIYVHGYWCYNWEDMFGKVEKIDTLKNTLSLVSNYWLGFNKEGTYRFLNSPTEIDEPGEFYVDRKDSILIWYPPENYNSKKDFLAVTRLDSEQMVKIVNSVNVVFDGICFAGGRNECVSIQDSRNISFRDCSFCRFGGSGAKILKSDDVAIEGCLFEELGGCGIDANVGARQTLKRGNLLVSNCIFNRLSNYRHTYRQAIRLKGCGATIAHCHFRVHPGSALRIDGNDVVVEYNVFENLVKESGDQGAIDMYKDFSCRGVVIRYNYWKNITGKHRNVAAVRFDDKISGQEVYGNIFENCGNAYFGAVQIHGGNHNHIYDNVFINCPAAVSFDRWKSDRFIKELEDNAKDKNLGLFATDVYKQMYPELNLPWNQDVNKNFIYGNLIINAKESFRRDGEVNEIRGNDVYNLPSKDIRSIPRLLREYGRNSVPFKRMGVERNIYR